MSLIFTDPIYAPLLGDAEIAAFWDADAQIARYRAFEAAYARMMGRFGLADAALAERAAAAIEAATIDPAALAAGTVNDGLPVPALVKILKAAAGADAAAVHKGATSQDVIDTAMALSAQATNAVLAARIATASAALATVNDRFGDAPLMGRTRMQAALEMRAGHRLGVWAQGLSDAGARLAAARPGIERLQLGGPVGDRRGLGDDFAAALAETLGLAAAPVWHANRVGVAEYGSALSVISGAIGKIGQDVALMAQAGEIGLAGGGGSSAMPHKQNPVAAEILATLARYNAAQLGGLHQALIHEQERSGAAWGLEWMILPGMAVATGAALSRLGGLLKQIERIGEQNG